VGIILNDDVVPSVSIADATVTEGDSGTKNLTFNVSLSAPTTEAVLVPYAISEGTAKSGVDFAGPLTGLLVVPAGMSTGQIIVPVLGDATFESDETLTVTLLAPGNASIARGVATGTILNNDAAPAISIADATISEGDEGMKNLTFTVTLSNPADHDVTVSIDTVDGTAREIFDFAGIHSGNLLIPAGMTSTQVTVLVKGDGRYELDETFSVVLTDPVNATLVRDTATGTIQNDDAPPEVSAADVSMLEGADGTSNLTFTLTLSAPSDVFVTLFYVIGGGTAVGGEDFVPMASGFHSAIFQPGTTSTQVSIPILGDHVVESDETVVLTMGTPMYATITDFTATGTILNDDVPPPPQIFAYSSPVTEGEPGTMTDLVFHVELTHASASPVSMSYRFNDFPADGFAQFGIDFTGPAPGVLTFAPGEVSKELHLSVAGDAVYEKDEIVRLELSNPSGGTFTSLLQVYAQVDSKILNDDVAPTISVADASVVEGDLGDKNLVFTVSLSNPSDEPVSVWFHATAGTALEGIDVVLPESDTLVFAPGETSLSVAVKVHGDLTVEGEETVGLTLSNPNHGTIGDGDATGQILDNDVSQGVTLLKKNLATFTDVDGDVVTVKVSKGTLDITDLLLTPEGLGYRFKALHLPMDDGKFNGAAVTITAKPSAAGGDGLVDLGRLDATGVKLGKVSVDGDLRQASAAAMASLTVYSLGERAAGAPDEELTSTISGKLGALTVKTDASHVTVHAGSIGTLKALALEDVTIAAGAITAMTAQSLENTDVFVQGGIGITALKSLNVSGSVRHSRVLAGYNAEGLGMYGGVKIGAVKVGGQWEASEIVAGVKTGADFLFGTDDDVSMGGGKVIAKIASITIAGAVLGTSDVTDDAFGFVADEIGALSVGKAKVPLVKGAHNDLSPRVLAWTGDVVVREVEDALG
jgi:hypothetical protein